MGFTVTLLGTDINYAPHPAKDFAKGETLSFVSSFIAGLPLKQPAKRPSATNKLNQSVSVINGADTFGFYVGDRIARGVLESLRAIARGENHINLVGFSRGGVEAILVAHELDRIKKLMNETPFDPRDCLNSDCAYTRAALEKFDEKIVTSIAAIYLSKDKLNALTLSIFSLDPVPGGNYLKAPSGWIDPRFYMLPTLVTEYEQYIYENEHSSGFKPIIPVAKDSTITACKFINLPGHHGTGCGNFNDQQGNPIPQKGETKGKTTHHTQELLILKLADFLKRNGMTFETDLNQIPDSKNIDPDLYKLIQPFLAKTVTRTEFDAAYLDLYQKIKHNGAAYLHFNGTYYPHLGFSRETKKFFGKKMEHRNVHYRNKSTTLLKDVDIIIPTSNFVNADHARILLNEKLGLNQDLPLPEAINRTITSLVEACHYQSRAASSSSTSSLAPLLQDKSGPELVLEGLRCMLSQISQKYLNDDHMSLEQRQQLFLAVKAAFTRFDNLEDGDLRNTILYQLHSGLQDVLKRKFNRIISNVAMLNDLMIADSDSDAAQPQKNMEQWLQQYKRMDEFKLFLDDFATFEPGLEYDLMKKQLNALQEIMVQVAGSYLYNKDLDINPLFGNEYHNQYIQINGISKGIAHKMREVAQSSANILNQSHLLEQLNQTQEQACLSVINGKLIPLTEKYLKHLADEARKIKHSNKKGKIYSNTLPEFLGSPSVTAKYNKIVKKYETVYNLLKTLKFSPDQPMPSDRLKAYAKALKEANKDVDLQRDPAWKRYFKNSFIAIAILLTGILPGLITLLAHSKKTGKSFLFFADSKGAQYRDVADKTSSKPMRQSSI